MYFYGNNEKNGYVLGTFRLLGKCHASESIATKIMEGSADGETRTRMALATRPSSVRVYHSTTSALGH